MAKMWGPPNDQNQINYGKVVKIVKVHFLFYRVRTVNAYTICASNMPPKRNYKYVFAVASVIG